MSALDSYAEGWEGMEDMYDSVKEPEVSAESFYGVPYTPDDECLRSIQSYLKRPGSIRFTAFQLG